MAIINVDLSEKVRPIKPLHGGGQPPLSGQYLGEAIHYLTEAGIPFSRLHDVGGAFGAGKYVDIPNIFRDFNADENDPASYDFAFTDVLIKILVDAGVEPYYRLGVTIENQAPIKAYRIDPPADYEKWARICEHIVAHYNEGWANGFHYGIRYWEIWNEPDNNAWDTVKDEAFNQMWTGTPEEYYRLYDVTAKHLKARFPDIKVGGYASCGFYSVTYAQFPHSHPIEEYATYVTYFRDFFAYVKEHQSPIDFFSWHSYCRTEETAVWADWLKEELDRLGYPDLETHLNEWNPFYRERGTAHHSAEVAGMMLALQEKPVVSVMCFYDTRLMGAYGGLFDSMKDRPTYAYYSMVAFNHLYRLGTEVLTECDTPNLYVVAASDGKKHALMVSNLTGKTQKLEIKGVDLTGARFSVIDEGRLLSWAPNADTIANNGVMLIEF